MAKENRGRLHRRLAAALAVLALGWPPSPRCPLRQKTVLE